MATQSVDLSKLFGAVAQTMLQNQSTLNEADTYNHDHGDNMVQTFEVITQAMKEKSNATPAEQLAYASQLLSAKSQSGSAKLYAQGLQDASKKFVGKTSITPSNGTTLDSLLAAADKAMYKVKQAGGNGYCLADDQPVTRALKSEIKLIMPSGL